MTKNQLFTEVANFYKGQLTLDKAKKLYEFEFGFVPEIEESTDTVTDEWCRQQGFPESVTGETLTFMKELQESGVTNMLESGPYIQARFGYGRKEVKEVLMTYISNYTLIYRTWELL